jgi:hypothetical protein
VAAHDIVRQPAYFLIGSLLMWIGVPMCHEK